MAIRLHNTRTQKVEDFIPLDPKHVRMYVCGITTYDLAHAGHARTFSTFDMLLRHLRARGLKVTMVRNVTDVDDKIVKRAAELGEAPLDLSHRMSVACEAELRTLGCLPPDHTPHVSSSMDDIVAFVGKLIEKDAAYVAATPKGNDVYFAVRSFADYGKLSKRKLDDLKAGARVEVGELKRDPLDFALWKAALPDELGWDSPWGRGRPGWHIECSAMAHRALGEHFDIHGGGLDLIFPHHENEIAQSESVFGPEFANVWMHGGFLEADGEKMSKSLGNFVTLAQVLDRNDPEALRYFFLGTHYRGPLGFDLAEQELADGSTRVYFPGIDEAERRVEYAYTTLEALARTAGDAAPAIGERSKKAFTAAGALIAKAPERVLGAMDDDLNSSVALSVISEVLKAANDVLAQLGKQFKKDAAVQAEAPALAAALRDTLLQCGSSLALFHSAPAAFAARSQARRLRLRKLSAEAIEAKIAERTSARQSKDFARSDAVRSELLAMGVELMDGSEGTTWRVMV